MYNLKVIEPGTGFSGIVTPTQTLYPNYTYYFTFDYGKLIELNTTEWVLSQLRYYLGKNYGYVLNVTRAPFSDRYVVAVQPSFQYNLNDWLKGFDYAWKAMGYDDVTFITAETNVATQVGGAPEVLKKAFGFVGETTYETLKPFLPWILAFGGMALIALIYMYGKRRDTK